MLIKGVAGKFDIGGFGTTQAQPTPDQQLNFTVKVTDGDGDSNTASFSIGIDGTGPYDDNQVVFSTTNIYSTLPGAKPSNDRALLA